MTAALRWLGFRVLTQTTNGIPRHGHHRAWRPGLYVAALDSGLTLSIAAAKIYVTRLLVKLDVRDRVQLVIIAYDAGLVAPAS
jgi:hypothetical protein